MARSKAGAQSQGCPGWSDLMRYHKGGASSHVDVTGLFFRAQQCGLIKNTVRSSRRKKGKVGRYRVSGQSAIR